MITNCPQQTVEIQRQEEFVENHVDNVYEKIYQNRLILKKKELGIP